MVRFLEQMPLYTEAQSLSSVDATDLTPESFQHEYIDRLRPCVIRGAVRHWPAVARWRDFNYLRQKTENVIVRVTTAPLNEYLAVDGQAPVLDMPFHSILDMCSEPPPTQRTHLAMHAISVLGKYAKLRSLREDILGFPFVRRPPPPRLYIAARAFLFRDSYTDWHYHDGDETLMCQIKENKEVLLLPPDEQTLQSMTAIREKNGGQTWDVDSDRFPDWKKLRPYRVVVREGDALYIPTFWFHAVESIEREFGWTVAWCWGTPHHLFDLRLPGVRGRFKQLIKTRKALGAVAAAAWSQVRRFGQPPFSV
jgi:hypothetical protein